uniref:Uncharacterized protein n=1 Tax=Peronospora matthiolae TaxID=2874970 RepID=A0AAV1VNL5_9STRA
MEAALDTQSAEWRTKFETVLDYREICNTLNMTELNTVFISFIVAPRGWCRYAGRRLPTWGRHSTGALSLKFCSGRWSCSGTPNPGLAVDGDIVYMAVESARNGFGDCGHAPSKSSRYCQGCALLVFDALCLPVTDPKPLEEKHLVEVQVFRQRNSATVGEDAHCSTAAAMMMNRVSRNTVDDLHDALERHQKVALLRSVT